MLVKCLENPLLPTDFSRAKGGAVPGEDGESGGLGGGRRHLLLLLHRGQPARIQDHLVAQRESDPLTNVPFGRCTNDTCTRSG